MIINRDNNKNVILNITVKHGQEFWFAKELQIALGYKEWSNFNKVIEIA